MPFSCKEEESKTRDWYLKMEIVQDRRRVGERTSLRERVCSFLISRKLKSKSTANTGKSHKSGQTVRWAEKLTIQSSSDGSLKKKESLATTRGINLKQSPTQLSKKKQITHKHKIKRK